MCNQQIQLRAKYVGNMTKRDGIEATCPRTWIFTNLSELFLYYLWNGDLNYFWNHTVDFICTIYKFKYIYIYVCIFVHFQLAWKTSFLCFPNHKHFSNSFYLLSAKSFTSFHLQVLTDYQTGNSFFPYFGCSHMLKNKSSCCLYWFIPMEGWMAMWPWTIWRKTQAPEAPEPSLLKDQTRASSNSSGHFQVCICRSVFAASVSVSSYRLSPWTASFLTHF